MARAIRTAVLALVAVVMGTAAVATTGALDHGGDDAAQPPSRPPSTSVAVRATSAAVTAPSVARPTEVPVLAGTAVPSVDGEDGAAPGLPDAVVAAVEADTAPGWQQRLGAAALERIDFPWKSLGFRIDFLPGREGYLGMTFPERRLIEIYVRDGLSVDEVARNTAHELGHAFDWVHNTPVSRAAYMRVRGIDPGLGWFACRGCTDLSTPAGDFAETFSYWVMQGEFPSRSKLGDATPDAAELRALKPLFSLPSD